MSCDLDEDEEMKATEKEDAINDVDMIKLVDESEHLFIRYAQQKLVDNKI